MPLIFAHRGYSLLYPENTMIAFQNSVAAHADGIELDVQLTSDGELVVIHDEKVDRTTNGTGYVRDYSFKQLRLLNAAANFKGKVKEAQIPALEEVFEWLKDTSLICNIEFKNNRFPYTGMEEKTIALIRKYNLSNQIVFSSFNHYSLVHSYRLAPDIETAILLSDIIYQPWIYAKAIKARAIHPDYRGLTTEVITNAVQEGMQIRAYTVNKENEMLKLMQTGVSALITDNPQLAYETKKLFYNNHIHK